MTIPRPKPGADAKFRKFESSASNTRLASVEVQAGVLTKAWRALAHEAKDAWDMMQGIGRPKSTGGLLAGAQQALAAKQARGPLNSLTDDSYSLLECSAPAAMRSCTVSTFGSATDAGPAAGRRSKGRWRSTAVSLKSTLRFAKRISAAGTLARAELFIDPLTQCALGVLEPKDR